MGVSRTQNNDIVINLRNKRNNDIVIKGLVNKKRKFYRTMQVDTIANSLVDKFNAPNSRNFFCKCAWNMDEEDIWSVYKQSHKPTVKSPLKYFISVCSIKMEG